MKLNIKAAAMAASLAVVASGAWAQKLDENLFDASGGKEFDMESAYDQLMADLTEHRAEQMGFQVSAQFSWMVAPEAFAYEDGLNILRWTAKEMYNWNSNQANNFAESLSWSGVGNDFSQQNRAARPWGIRFAWVEESLLPVSLSLGAGQMGLDYYIEGRRTSDSTVIGLTGHQLRAATYLQHYADLGSDPWNHPGLNVPSAISVPYVEAGVGKRVHPLASLFVHYRQPVAASSRIRNAFNAANAGWDDPTLYLRDDAPVHVGPIFTIQAQYHGRFMEWGLERVVRMAPTGTWPTYLQENGSMPVQSGAHTEVSIGLRF
jgi:hypothetical protein